MIPILIDVAIVLVLAFFVWRGACKGLILTLFGLLAVFVAWFGAGLVAENLSRPVANIIRPSIQNTIEELLAEQGVPNRLPEAVSGEAGSAAGQEQASLRQVLSVLDEAGLVPGLQEYLEEAVRTNAIKVTSTVSAAVASYLANLIATAGLFGVSFLLILLVWFLISRAMDLAFHLPILNAVNRAGGGLLGLLKGLAVVMVALWMARLAGWVTPENSGPLAELMTVPRLNDLLRSLLSQ